MLSASFRTVMRTPRIPLDPTFASKTNVRFYKHVSHLEVESKFNVTQRLISIVKDVKEHRESIYSPIDSATGALRISDYRNLSLTDDYFDRQNQLEAKGIWIRKRTKRAAHSKTWKERATNELPSGKWEAKVRSGGDYVVSSMIEFEGKEKVMELWAEHFGNGDILEEDMVASIHTDRDIFRLEETPLPERWNICAVIDHCSSPVAMGSLLYRKHPYSHVIGEVEFSEPIRGNGKDQQDDKLRTIAETQMNASLEAFMKRYSSLFPTQPKPVGKLSAYFESKHREEDVVRQGLTM